MTKPKVKAKTPDNPDINALIDLHEGIISSRTPILAIVEFTPRNLDYPLPGGDAQITLEITYVEGLTGKDREAAEKIADRRFAQRTGQKSRAAATPTPDTPLDIENLPDGVEEPGATVTPIGGE